MKISEIMSRRPITVSSNTSYRELWQIIFKKHVNALPVVDAQKRLVGIITREDLLAPLYPQYKEFAETLMTATDFEEIEERIHDLTSLKARRLMCKRLIFTRDDTQIMRALSRMMVRRINQLPVLDNHDRLVGWVTKGDIFYALFRKHLIRRGSPHVSTRP